MVRTEAIDGSAEQNDKYVDGLTECEDSETVVKAMLTENTGRHLLDSGDHYGRNFEENHENPPWEKPHTVVERDYVVRNLYHHLTDLLQRDGTCTCLERALYRHGANSTGSWLTDMEEVAARLHNGDRDPQSFNSYNFEYGAFTQDIQGIGFDTRGDSFLFLQVHGGCDIRGGYTKPRVFRARWTEVVPYEFQFYCPSCDWSAAESSLDYEVIEDMTFPSENALECPECGSHEVRA